MPIKNTFDNEEFRLFIFGGSQGAKVFSQIIPEAITELLKLNPSLKIHLTNPRTTTITLHAKPYKKRDRSKSCRRNTKP